MIPNLMTTPNALQGLSTLLIFENPFQFSILMQIGENYCRNTPSAIEAQCQSKRLQALEAKVPILEKGLDILKQEQTQAKTL